MYETVFKTSAANILSDVYFSQLLRKKHQGIISRRNTRKALTKRTGA